MVELIHIQSNSKQLEPQSVKFMKIWSQADSNKTDEL